MKKTIFGVSAFVLLLPAVSQDYDAMRVQCSNYGFKQGTEGSTTCVQQLDAEIREGQRRDKASMCQQALRQQAYYCSKMKSEIGNALSSFECGKAESNANRLCVK